MHAILHDGIKAYNSQPQVTITSHSNSAEIQDGYIVSFVGQVSDANHQNSELIVTWSTNNGELCSDLVPEDNGETICDAVLVESDTDTSYETEYNVFCVILRSVARFSFTRTLPLQALRSPKAL